MRVFSGRGASSWGWARRYGALGALVVGLSALLLSLPVVAQEPPVDDSTAQVDGLEDPASDTGPASEAPASTEGDSEVVDVSEGETLYGLLGDDEVQDDEYAAQEFRRELRTVEEDVSSLKERVFRSKATLQLLKELVIDAAASGSRVVLWHINKLGGGYSMESVQYFLNGKNIFSKVDPGGALDDMREIKVHEQTVAPGTHNLQVNIVLRGKGYKIFSYLRTYQFKVQSSYTFRVEEGKISLIRVIADSRGGLRNFVERPTIQYDERKETFREE